MPIRSEGLDERFAATTGNGTGTSPSSELAYLGNRELEAVLFQLLEVSVRPPPADDEPIALDE